MTGDNSEQIAEWNGAVGDRWAEMQAELDALIAPFGEDGLKAAAARPGERVIDVGCGCGDTSLVLARTVGASGQVTGIDISKVMLDVARRRADEAGLTQLGFEQADASNAALPQGADLIFSRFGVMFFAAPVPAFAHMRRALKDRGRLAFVCWQAARDNPWASVPVIAGRQAVGLTQQSQDPHAPGPFAFADETRVRAILLEADFKDVEAEPGEHPMMLGSSARSAAEAAVRMGPVSRVVREAGPEAAPRIIDAIEKALAPLAARDGSVALPGRTWIVTAKAG